jgi:alpha/beta superfamily hydrolase
MRTGISYLEDGANAARAGLSLSGFDFEALIGANVAIRLNSKKETLLSR